MAGKLRSSGRSTRKPVPKKPAEPEAPTCCEADWTPSFNETTLKAMEDVRTGKNLIALRRRRRAFREDGDQGWQGERESLIPRPRFHPRRPWSSNSRAQFGRDMKRQEKRGKDLAKLHAIVEALSTRQPLPPKNRDHVLAGKWKGFRDCHIEPDWVLIYQLSPG